MDFLSFKRDLIKGPLPYKGLMKCELCGQIKKKKKKVESVLLSLSLKMGIAGIHTWKTLSNQLYSVNPCTL